MELNETPYQTQSYLILLDWIEGLPPDAPSVKWVHSLNPASPVSNENSILIPAQARIDHRRPLEPSKVPRR